MPHPDSQNPDSLSANPPQVTDARLGRDAAPKALWAGRKPCSASSAFCVTFLALLIKLRLWDKHFSSSVGVRRQRRVRMATLPHIKNELGNWNWHIPFFFPPCVLKKWKHKEKAWIKLFILQENREHKYTLGIFAYWDIFPLSPSHHTGFPNPKTKSLSWRYLYNLAKQESRQALQTHSVSLSLSKYNMTTVPTIHQPTNLPIFQEYLSRDHLWASRSLSLSWGIKPTKATWTMRRQSEMSSLTAGTKSPLFPHPFRGL